MTVTLIRTVILYLLIIVGLRLLGKHQLGELEPSELVLALIIADLASVPMQDNGIPLLSGIIPIVVLLCLDLILSVAAMSSIKFRALICGRPSIVIEKGKLVQTALRKNRFTIDELMEELRCKGYTDLAAVEYAILETSGQLSVLPKAEEKPLTAAQFGLTPQETGLPVVLISDGRLMEHNLKARGYEEGWLHKQLTDHGVKRVDQVFLLTVDESGGVYFAAKEGKA